LLGATVHPELTGRIGKDSDFDRTRIARKAPPTNDPAAASLTLTPADDKRDVEARLAAYGQIPADAPELTLAGALRQAQITSREYLTAQEDYLLAAIRLLVQRHLWGPQFFGSTSAETTVTGVNGSFVAPLAIINELRATQRLPSGGTLEAQALWNATEQLRDVSTGRYVQSSALVLSGSIPLLRGAGELVAQEDLTQAERDLVYAARAFETTRRTLLVQFSRDYFSLLQQQRTIENQGRALDALRKLEERTKALVQAGRLAEFELNIARSDVLRAAATLASLREQFILSLDRYKIRLGLDVNVPLVVKGGIPELPEPEITPEEAGSLALDYRLDLQTQRDRLDDAKRQVVIARNGLLPDATVFGSATLRTKPTVREGGFVYETGDAVYNAGVRVDWGLDREPERLALRTQQIGEQRSERSLAELRDNVVLDARAAVREIDRARFALQLAEQSVLINQRRAKEQELKADEVTAQQSVDTANALRDAENARDQAITDLRNSVLGYLLTTGQLRVTRDGELQLPRVTAPALPTPPTPAPLP
jgi:outer membrane protein TolC